MIIAGTCSVSHGTRRPVECSYNVKQKTIPDRFQEFHASVCIELFPLRLASQ